MKKLSFISLSSLLVAVILTTVGVAMINKSDLNFGDVYDRFDENISIVQTNSDYSRSEDTDLTEIGNMSEDEYATYQLNEFNTLCIMADRCTVKTVLTASEDMVISLDRVQKAVGHMTLQTAIKGGNLYAKFMWYGEPTASIDEVTLTVGIPENYKGGYKISAADSVLDIDEIESAMDISMNLYNCTLNANVISGRKISLEASGSSADFGSVTAKDGFSLTGVSVQVNADKVASMYSVITANSSDLSLNSMSGSLTTDTTLCTENYNYEKLGGNITAKSVLGELNITVPKQSNAALRHVESYAKYECTINPPDENDKNVNSRYTVDTNVKFGIVTLAEKE